MNAGHWRQRALMRVPGLEGLVGKARRRFRRIGRRVSAVPVVRLAIRTVRETGADDATHMAAGVSFYAILSLFPMTLGLASVMGLVLPPGNTENQIVGFFRDYLPGVGDVLAANVQAGRTVQGFTGVVSLLGLLWTASAVFGAVARSVNRAWDIHRDRPFWLAKLRQIGMALSVGVMFLLSIGATTALEVVGRIDLSDAGSLSILQSQGMAIVARSLPFGFTFTIFLLIYKFVPNTTTRWRYIWPGVILAAASFEISKTLFVFYMNNFADYARVYGSLGSVVALMVWIYLSTLILIVGAEFASEYERVRTGVARGQLIRREPWQRDANASAEGQE